MRYQFLEHTADVKFQAVGKSLEEAFENSALALKEVMTKGEKIKEIKSRIMKVKGKDNEQLLLNFLGEFLYLLDSEDFVLGRIAKLRIKDNKLEAEIIGDKASNYSFNNDVKAVTYSQMYVKKAINKYIVQVVLDV